VVPLGGQRALSCGGGCGTGAVAGDAGALACRVPKHQRRSILTTAPPGDAVRGLSATTGLPVRRAAPRCRVPGSLPGHTRAVAGGALAPICCCRSHWTRSSGRPPLCSLVRCFNGSWSRWITWSRYWLACRSLFCCRFLLVMCLMGRDVACRSRAWLDSTGLGQQGLGLQPCRSSPARQALAQ